MKQKLATILRPDSAVAAKGFNSGHFVLIGEETSSYYFTVPMNGIKHAFRKNQLLVY